MHLPLYKLCPFPLLAWTLLGAAPNARVDAIFSPLINARSPGAAVLVRQNGHTVFARGYGVRDLYTLRPIDAHTNFRLASFTKQFTAMAIMLLVHDSKLSYNRNLAEIFPGFPAYGRAITVRHLLTHTSGLPDYETLMDEKEKAQGAIWSPTKQIHDADVLALLAQQAHAKFAPGTSWAYSNSGYVVLGLIVAKASGMPYPEFLRRRIFSPLKMSRTLAYVAGESSVGNRAFGYSPKDGRWEDTDQSATSATLGDGGIYSNLTDLAKWDAALTSGKLLSKIEMAPAWEPVKLIDGSQPYNDTKPVSYGFGWFLNPFDNRSRVWHAGSTSGFRTVIERFTNERLSIVILCNRTDLDPAQLAEQIAIADDLARLPKKPSPN
jgi:CubicO group peptidase (beta-lactamase class C family)